MQCGRNARATDEAMNWLQGVEVEGSTLGRPVPDARDVVHILSWLLSLTGPALLAVDQIDPIITALSHSLTAPDADAEEQRKARSIVDNLAIGLMDLHGVTRRTLTVVTALAASWNVLENYALSAAAQQFRSPPDRLRPIAAAAHAEHLVASRLAASYARHGVAPPYPTYPFRPEAFASAVDMLPRMLLRRCDEHRRHCVAASAVTELASFIAAAQPRQEAPPPTLDHRFEALRREAKLDGLPGGEADETRLVRLLIDTLQCYVLQMDLPEDVDSKIEADFSEKVAPLHARLRFIHRAEDDRETHHCFRVLPHTHYLAFQSRLRQAITASGIGEMLRFRHLVIIRQDPPPSGAATKKLCDQFAAAGGRFVRLTENALRIMLALQALQTEKHADFEGWMKQRRPLAGFAPFVAAGLADAEPPVKPGPGATAPADLPVAPPPPVEPRPDPLPPTPDPAPPADAIPLGRRLVGGMAERPTD